MNRGMSANPLRAGSVAYIMEGPHEADRLERKTFDEESSRQLDLVGLLPGMKALDAGSGTGAVARTMARIVGPEGYVIALDASGTRAHAGRGVHPTNANLAFVRAAVEAAPLASESFDFVWSRFLFEYLPEPDVATRELVRLLRPGGKLVLGDLDNMALIHFPMSSELAAGLGVLREALAGRVDLFAGRKLFSRMKSAGLEALKAHILPYHVYAGAAPGPDLENWATKLHVIGSQVRDAFGGKVAYASFCAEFMRHLQSEEVFTYSVLILVEGRKVNA